MNIKELYQLANQMKYYDFENALAKKFFNRPITEDTSSLTDKLRLHIVNRSLKEKETITFGDWIKTNCVRNGSIYQFRFEEKLYNFEEIYRKYRKAIKVKP